jgi:hypothetical protein
MTDEFSDHLAKCGVVARAASRREGDHFAKTIDLNQRNSRSSIRGYPLVELRRKPMSDDFSRAHERARNGFPGPQWDSLPASEQARAIYDALRQLDAERAAGKEDRPGDPGPEGDAPSSAGWGPDRTSPIEPARFAGS